MIENSAEKQFYADAYLILTPNVLFHRLEINQTMEISIWLFCSYILDSKDTVLLCKRTFFTCLWNDMQYTYYMTSNFNSDSVKSKFLRFAYANFSNRIFSKMRGRKFFLTSNSDSA